MKQKEILESFISQKVDGIAISCAERRLPDDTIDKAIDAGIPVVTWDSDAPKSKRIAFYGVDDFAGGQIMGEEAAKLLNGKGTVAFITSLGANNLQRRLDGVKDALAKYPGIKIVEIYDIKEDTVRCAELIATGTNRYPDLGAWISVGGWPVFTRNALGGDRSGEDQVHLVRHDPAGARICSAKARCRCCSARSTSAGAASRSSSSTTSSTARCRRRPIIDSGVDVVTKDERRRLRREVEEDGERQLNIGEIARRAHVSTATVSRTLNQTGAVRPETARKVWRVAAALNYYPNSHARALVSGRSRLLGLIVSDITNPFFPELVHSFEALATAQDYDLILTSTGYQTARMIGCVRRMLERKVDGVAIMTSEMDLGLIKELARRGVPLVFMDVGRVGPRMSHVLIDYAHGIRQAVDHLVALGHKRIAFIAGPLDLHSARTRRQAFLDGMRAHRLAPDREAGAGRHPHRGRRTAGDDRDPQERQASHGRGLLERLDGDRRHARARRRGPARARGRLGRRLRRHPAGQLHPSAADLGPDVGRRRRVDRVRRPLPPDRR